MMQLLSIIFLHIISSKQYIGVNLIKVKEGSKLSLFPLIMLAIPAIGLGYLGSQQFMVCSSYFQDSFYLNKTVQGSLIQAEQLNNPFLIQALFTFGGIHFANRIRSFQDILYKLNLYGIERAFFHKFYIDYLVNNILKIQLKNSQQVS